LRGHGLFRAGGPFLAEQPDDFEEPASHFFPASENVLISLLRMVPGLFHRIALSSCQPMGAGLCIKYRSIRTLFDILPGKTGRNWGCLNDKHKAARMLNKNVKYTPVQCISHGAAVRGHGHTQKDRRQHGPLPSRRSS
jgi:hypothetical protein